MKTYVITVDDAYRAIQWHRNSSKSDQTYNMLSFDDGLQRIILDAIYFDGLVKTGKRLVELVVKGDVLPDMLTRSSSDIRWHELNGGFVAYFDLVAASAFYTKVKIFGETIVYGFDHGNERWRGL